ncbi:MAG TPA: hypothetical protein DCP71_06400 [Verrucomicrobiales bacterium]|nr:hypothetical protein [Verrucomicrobiales bacterium]
MPHQNIDRRFLVIQLMEFPTFILINNPALLLVGSSIRFGKTLCFDLIAWMDDALFGHGTAADKDPVEEGEKTPWEGSAFHRDSAGFRSCCQNALPLPILF